MTSPSRRRSRRLRGAAAVSIVATAGLFATYLGSPRVPRAYAQPGAPFEALFTGVDGPGRFGLMEGRPRSRSSVVTVQSAPNCDFSVDDSTALHAAVASSSDDSVICITDDIPDLSEQLVIDDTGLTLIGAGGDDSLASVTLTADDTRHIYATFDDTLGSLSVTNLTLTGGDSGAEPGGSIFVAGTMDGDRGVDLFLEDDTFIGNTSAGSGGAIYAIDFDQVVAYDSLLTQNSSGSHGGAMYLKDSRVGGFTYSRISENYAGGRGGGIALEAGTRDGVLFGYASSFVDDSAGVAGGAISTYGAGQSVITYFIGFGGIVPLSEPSAPASLAVEFTGNSAPTGGAIWAKESGPSSDANVVLFGEINISGNSATAGDGGAILVSTDDTTPFPYPGFRLPNLLLTGYGFFNVGAADGRVYAADVNYGSVTLSANSAAGSGGGAHVTGVADFGGWFTDTEGYVIPGVNAVGNSADDSGGALYVDGRATVSYSAFVDNLANLGSGGAIAMGDSFAQSLVYQGAFIESSYFAENESGDAYGGAVFVDDSAGVLSVYDSTFVRNFGEYGGGAMASFDDTGVIVNSTLVDNGGLSGGGVYMTSGELIIDFSTLTGNYADTGAGVSARRLTVTNSIVSGNEDYTQSAADVYARDAVDDSFSLFTSSSSVDDTVGWTPGVGTLFSANAVVGALGNNGGFQVADDTVIPTMLPLAGSVVIDAADPDATGFPDFDQRGDGFPRILGGRADMGAAEWRPPTPPAPPTPASPPRDVAAVGGDREITVTWQAPASAGSFPVSTYQAVAQPDPSSTAPSGSCLVVAPALTCTISGLANGEPYTVRVRALTGAGWGAYSDPSDPVTPEVVKTIVITGSRTGSSVEVAGVTTGLVGTEVTPWVRFPGPYRYEPGTGVRTVEADGTFTWQRQTRKKTYVYFVADDGVTRSNRVIIRP